MELHLTLAESLPTLREWHIPPGERDVKALELDVRELE